MKGIMTLTKGIATYEGRQAGKFGFLTKKGLSYSPKTRHTFNFVFCDILTTLFLLTYIHSNPGLWKRQFCWENCGNNQVKMAWKADKRSTASPGKCSCIHTQVCGCNCCKIRGIRRARTKKNEPLAIWCHWELDCVTWLTSLKSHSSTVAIVTMYLCAEAF